MLIGFTLLVAGLIGGYVTQIAQQQGTMIRYCSGARILLLSGVKSPSGQLSDVTFSIHNFGDVDLTLDLLQTYANGTVRKLPASQTIKAGEVGQMTVTGIDLSDASEFTVRSQECPGAADFISVTDLKSAQ
jgi:hypothetical protein